MTCVAVFIVGPPAAGKTTLTRLMLGDDTTETDDPPLTFAPGICAIGHFPDGRFGGGDHIGPGGGKAAIEAAAKHRAPLTLIDGNRFALPRHRGTAVQAFDRVLVVHLDAPEPECHRRRVERGSKTNPAWMNGRRGMAERFASECPQTMRLSGLNPPAANVAAIREQLARISGG